MTIQKELSDFHKMTFTIMKVFYNKQKSNVITYRSYKHFSNEVFMSDIQNRISQVTSESNEHEFDSFNKALNEAI